MTIMYNLELKDNIKNVREDFWKLNQNTFSKLYRTKEWLIDSQKRLGDRDVYIECYYDSQPVLLLPVIIFEKRSTYPPVDPHKMIESALGISNLDGVVAISISLFGLGCPILSNNKDIDWDIVIGRIMKLLKEKFGCSYFACSYLSDIDNPISIGTIRNINYKILPHKPYGILNVKDYTNFEDYLRCIKSSARRAYHKEKAMHAANGIEFIQTTINEYPFDLLGRLASNVYTKYGSNVSFERLSSFAEYIHKTFEKSGIFVCKKADTILSYALYIEHDKVLHMKMLGRDYEQDKFSTYFTSSYYSPISYSLEKDIELINYGAGSIETKTKRNVQKVDSYSYVFY